MKKLFFLPIVLLLLSGCATSYENGYSETRIDDNCYRVSFDGNKKTTTTRAMDLALLRASELTLENGYKYFIVVDDKQNTDDNYTPSMSSTYKGKTYTTNAIYSTTRSSTITIVCYLEKPDNSNIVYNAEYVAFDLGKKYGITIQALYGEKHPK
ncbi:MAG: hypothetical protein COW71_07505 [Ignavibacteriales bacterium CG18_big_fil_WC_8_21_14_2_50_31_20]|nr:MAG: hypothetical protein COW71_07505 [Ignavibacteriales bacterium CG18_big_fil_WC_8_21_14_2_50_31_20]